MADQQLGLNVGGDVSVSEKRLLDLIEHTGTTPYETGAVFRTVEELSSDGIVLLEVDDQMLWPIRDCNSAYCRMNGYAPYELIGQPIDAINAKVRYDRKEYLRRLRNGEVIKADALHVTKQGVPIIVHVRSCLIKHEGREYVLGVDSDITNSFAPALLSYASAAIVAVGRDGLITQVNKFAEHMFGYEAPQVFHQPIKDYLSDGQSEFERVKIVLEKNRQTDQSPLSVHTAIKDHQRRRIPVLLTGTALRNIVDEVEGYLLLINDLREQEFLTEIDRFSQDVPIAKLPDLQLRLNDLLAKTCAFFGAEYAVLFASTQEKQTVLPLIGYSGMRLLPDEGLPHFNWRKADLIPAAERETGQLGGEAAILADWRPDSTWKSMLLEGIRGPNATFFHNLSCGIPTRLADTYRGILVLGPMPQGTDLEDARDYLKSAGQGIGVNVLSWLQALHLEQKRLETEKGITLLMHRSKMRLVQMIGKFGRIKRSSEVGSQAWMWADEGEKLAKDLGETTKRGWLSYVSELEKEDFSFLLYPLPVLVETCVESFRNIEGNRTLRIEPRVETLPYAEIDHLFLSIALCNLIDNALKYSFDRSVISISSEYDTQQARIIVSDIGRRLPENARQNLRDPGHRWGEGVQDVPGLGYGLWEASMILAAHDGKIDFSSVNHERGGHLVQVWMTFPLRGRIAR